ncbi:hypothetical protein BSK63_23605 [Paenibacillus odorifer]|uniref:hypothetical protein n=1 Tax=Paenibacillus odorifer TaxID=189426 RepID=UPI00096D3F42|nr:hypothetical protein [Paenibacillus odorifer]OME28900.1 hypothetical protein BSK63_23605 [Paenibacillus odorifer]
MEKIICFSASDKKSLQNYNKTVVSPMIVPYFSEKFGDKQLSVWGSKKRNWDNVKVGDIALFYSQKHFISYGKIVGKIADPVLSNELWDTTDYKYLVFIDCIKQISIPRSKFWEELNYSDKTYIIGTYIPSIKKQEEMVLKHGSLSNLLKNTLNIEL